MQTSKKSKIVSTIFKNGLFSLLYTLIMCPLGLLIMMIPTDEGAFMIFLQVFLGILAIGFFCLLNFIYYKSVGEEEMKSLNANDTLRKNEDKLSSDTVIQTEKEYSSYKGLLYGLVAVMPLVIMIIIYAILQACGVSLTKPSVDDAGNPITVSSAYGLYGGLIKIIYSLYYTPFAPIATFGSEALKNGSIYFTLIAVPVSILSTWIPYNFGAFKAKKQLNAMNQTSQYIYGGKQSLNPALEFEKELKKDPKKYKQYLKQQQKNKKKNKRK